MNGYKRILLLVLIMAAVAMTATGAAFTILYNTAFEEQRARLSETAKSQARLMEAMARHDQVYEIRTPGGPAAATISQIREALSNYQQFGETGEFTLARREGDKILFLLLHHHHVDEPKPIPFASSLAEPMRRALSGRSGVMVGLDYHGVMVLAAHEPVAILDLGIVAKIDLAEIRAPFIRAGIIVAAIAVLIVAMGAGIFFLVSDPLIRRIRESEGRFRTIVANLPGGVIRRVLKPDGTLYYDFVSEGIHEFFGIDPQEMKADATVLRKHLHPDDYERLQEAQQRSAESLEDMEIEARVLMPDGRVKWAQSLTRPRRLENGDVVFDGIVLDITERKQAEEALRKSNRAFKMLSVCKQALVRVNSEEDLFSKMCRIVVDDGGYRLAWIGLKENDEEKNVRPAAHHGFEDGYLETLDITWDDTEKDQCPTGKAIRIGKPVTTRDILNDPDFEPWRAEATKRGYASSIALPLFVEGEVVGAFNVYAGDTDVFDGEEVQILEDLTQDISFGIQTLRQRRQRREAEDAAQSLGRIIDSSSNEVYIFDAGTLKFREVNRGARENLGYSMDELSSLTPLDLKPEFTDDSFGALIEPLRSGAERKIRFETVHRRKDGSEYPVEVHLELAASETPPVFFSIVLDITERKQVEKALMESEERFRLAFDESAVPMGLTDPESGRFYRANSALCRWLGYTQEEMAEKTVSDITHPDDRARSDELRRKLIEKGTGHFSLKKRYIRKDGGILWGDHNTSLHCDDQGKVLYIYGQIRDVTEQKKAEEALRESEDRLRGAIESLQEGFVLYDADDRLVMANSVYRRINPRAGEFPEKSMRFEDVLRAIVERGHIPVAIGREEEFIRERLEQHRNPKGPILRQTGDGSWYIIMETRTPEGGIAITFSDITDLKRSEGAFKVSEERLRAVVEYSPGAIIIKDLGGRYLIANKMFCDWYGIDRENIIGKSVRDFLPKESADLVIAQEHKVAETGTVIGEERQVTYPDGVTRDVFRQKFPVFGPDGDTVAIGTVIDDITEHKKAEQALMEREERFRAVTETANDAIISIDQGGKVILWNKAAEQTFGYAESEILGKPLTKIIPKRFRKRHREGLKRLNKTGVSNLLGETMELVGLRKDGGEFPIELSLFMWKTDGTVNYVGIVHDITGRKKAEAEVLKLSSAVEQSPASVVITDTEGTIEYVNEKFTEITGYSSEESIGQNPRILKSGVTPDSVYERLWADITAGKEWRGTLCNRRKDGTEYLADTSVSPIVAADGTVIHFIGSMQDITERVEGERRLKQVEKMEALGGLACGIAHDFNNMLLPILSLTDMTRKSLPEDSRERLRLDKVIEAATRAKNLVARILAFGHQENAVRENIDIHPIIRESMELLRSTLPTTLKIKTRLDKNTGTVFADSGQIGSVLLNLAANAADAMHGKTGEMTVSLSPVKVGKKKAASIHGLHEGKYAKLVVKDDGCGMDEKTLTRAMDPFFTTKPVGEGTGLGLSMVHGIVSKHGGAVLISSTQGKGTMVEVYLPLVEDEADHESRDGVGGSGDA